MTHRSTIDINKIDRFRRKNAGLQFFGLSMKLYLAIAPQIIDTINESVENQKWSDLQGQVVQLRQVNAGVGAKGLIDLCDQLEQAVQNTEATTIEKISRKLKGLYSSTVRELQIMQAI